MQLGQAKRRQREAENLRRLVAQHHDLLTEFAEKSWSSISEAVLIAPQLRDVEVRAWEPRWYGTNQPREPGPGVRLCFECRPSNLASPGVARVEFGDFSASVGLPDTDVQVTVSNRGFCFGSIIKIRGDYRLRHVADYERAVLTETSLSDTNVPLRLTRGKVQCLLRWHGSQDDSRVSTALVNLIRGRTQGSRYPGRLD